AAFCRGLGAVRPEGRARPLPGPRRGGLPARAAAEPRDDSPPRRAGGALRHGGRAPGGARRRRRRDAHRAARLAHRRLNTARTLSAKSVPGVQVGRAPLHPPVQPEKRHPVAATALRRSGFPAVNVLPQRGVHRTAPLPTAVIRSGIRSGPNTAETATGPSSLTLQMLFPLQPPVQRTKRDVAVPSGASITWLPGSHWVVHVAVHETPGRSDETVPAPEKATVRPTGGTSSRCSQGELLMSSQPGRCP